MLSTAIIKGMLFVRIRRSTLRLYEKGVIIEGAKNLIITGGIFFVVWCIVNGIAQLFLR